MEFKEKKKRSLGLVLKLNTYSLPTPLLYCLGLGLYFVILMCFILVPGSGVIISSQNSWHPIQFSIQELSMHIEVDNHYMMDKVVRIYLH